MEINDSKNINTGNIDTGGGDLLQGDYNTVIKNYYNQENESIIFKSKIDLSEDYFEILGNKISFEDITFIERTIKFIEKENSKKIDVLNLDVLERNTLLDAIASNSKIVLLGNSGIGKSTELKFLFQNLFFDKKNEFVPYFKNLKTFTTNYTIEEFIIYDKVVNWNKMLFIFDGIDEIKDISDFTSKLDFFISKLDLQNGFEYKIILSCRNNVFEKISNQITGFKTAKIEPLNTFQSIELFEKIINREITELERENLVSRSEFLQNPFQVKLIADNFLRDNDLNIEFASLWEKYINKRLQNDKIEKFNKGGVTINIIQFKKDAEKLALVNELEQKSYFNKNTLNDLFEPISDDFADDFCQNGLIDQVYDVEQYFFEHKSIQEYFAALNFTKLKASVIIDFLKINLSLGDKMHPSLYNVASLILSILPENTKENNKEKIIDWLQKTQPELIIKTFDSSQSTNTKIQVFQNYFEKQCVEKGYWFNTNNSVSEEEFARFGDCKENAVFLFEIIKNPERHFRTQISAIQILGEFTLDLELFTEIQSYLFEKLKNFVSSENNKEFYSSIIYFFRSQISRHTTLKDSIIEQIFDIYKSNSNKAINRSLLGLIVNEENIDKHFDFIKREFEYEFGLKNRAEKDDVFRGNDWILKELILRLEKVENFIELAVYFCDDYNYRYDDYIPKIIERIKYFNSKEEKFIEFFISKFKELELKNRRFSEEILYKVITELNCFDKAFELLYDINDFSERKYILAQIITEKTVNRIIEDFSELNQSEIEGFRNILSNSNPNKNIARIFEKETISKGFEYSDKLPLEEEIKERQLVLEKHSQNKFDLLLNKVELFRTINNFYQILQLESVNREQIFEKQNEFYSKEGWNTPLPLEYEILHFLSIRFNQNITIEKVETAIDQAEIYLELIKREIKKDDKIKINENQLLKIQNECEQLESTLNFSSIVKIIDNNSFSVSNEYPKIELLLHFHLNHNILISDATKLNCIQIFELDKHNALEENFTQFVNSISKTELAKQKVVENINNYNEILTDFMMQKHINFAINNNLSETFSVIDDYYKSKIDIYPGDKLFTKYVSLSNNRKILNAHLENNKIYSFWSVLDLIIEDTKLKDEYKDSLISSCKEYLTNEEREFKHKAIKTLFLYKDEEAIDFYIDLLDRKLTRDISLNSFKDYNVLKGNDFSIVKKLYEKLYEIKSNSFEYSYANTFVTTYISNICNNENDFNEIMTVLSNIKVDLEKDKVKNV